MQTETLWRGDTIELPAAFELPPGEAFSVHVEAPDGLAARLFWVRPVKAYIGRNGDWNNSALKEYVPDILWESLPESVPADGLLRLWLRVAAPKNAVPGVHTVSLHIACTGQTQIRNFQLRVVDLTLPEGGFSLELWQYPYTAARYYGVPAEELFGQEHCGLLRGHLRLYNQAGGDILTCTICEDPWNSQTFDPYPSMVKWTRRADGSFVFDYTHFDAWINLAEDCGLTGAIKCFSLLPWGNRLRFWDEQSGKELVIAPKPGSREWRRIFGAFLADFIAHLDANGRFSRTYIALDERPAPAMRHALRLVSRYVNADGNPLKISCAVNSLRRGRRLFARFDDVSMEQKQVPRKGRSLRKIITKRRENGQLTTLYNCVGDYPGSFARSLPEESAWAVWYALAQGMDGFLRWALDAWVGDPLTDISYKFWESGDPFFIYPAAHAADSPLSLRDSPPAERAAPRSGVGSPPRESPRFAMLSQGVRDVRKARYLLEYGSAETRDKLKELLENMRRPNGKINAYGAKEGTEESAKQVLADLRSLRDAL
ncbi:MAG: DUF4091 domain-containing protein [Oscillospiraceae bacterium]|jgi:hypothetical protein|nr:DUF4091 domain-containing protein [Oscillospiraceae bacterium]